MEDINRYLLIIIGNSDGIEKDLKYIADGDSGIDFVDSKLIFIGTFYSQYSTNDIHEKLIHRPAFMLFNITNNDNYGINLPTKYYTGIFPEVTDLIDEIRSETPKKKDITNNVKSNVGTNAVKMEEYTSLNDILDKLSRNNYNRECLTENELKILNQQ